MGGTPDDYNRRCIGTFTGVPVHTSAGTDSLQCWRVSAATYPVVTVASYSRHHVNPSYKRLFSTAGVMSSFRSLYHMCLVPVIGASGYSDDITISSWTLSRYRDPQKSTIRALQWMCYFHHISTVGVFQFEVKFNVVAWSKLCSMSAVYVCVIGVDTQMHWHHSSLSVYQHWQYPSCSAFRYSVVLQG